MSTIQEIPARQGRAVRVDRGQRIKIINTFGHQVVDFWAFHATDLNSYLSMQHTRSTLSRITPRAGDTLVDNRREPMLVFEFDDSPAIHDTLIAACDQYRYEKLGCPPGHGSCAENCLLALASLNLTIHGCPSSFNLWMNNPVDQSGALEWLAPVAKPGNSVIFRALVDSIAVMSACPQDIVPVNDGRPVSAQYVVLGP